MDLSVDQTNEWSLLKDQFDALARGEDMREDSIEKLCDDQIRRRFAEWIIWAAEHKSKLTIGVISGYFRRVRPIRRPQKQPFVAIGMSALGQKRK